MTLDLINIRGFLSHQAELEAYLAVSEPTSALLYLNETFLDKSIKNISISNYTLISRRDRDDGRTHGGVALFARSNIEDEVTLFLRSDSAERLWHILHTSHGPVLLCIWYRPPAPGEVESIRSMITEWLDLSESVIGTIIIGDLNIHHKRWLRYSSSNSVEGSTLLEFCLQHGFKQMIKTPTRDNHLLDLVITDLPDDVVAHVHGQIADYSTIKYQLKFDNNADLPITLLEPTVGLAVLPLL